MLLGRLTQLGKRRRAAHRRHKVGVAQTAGTTGRHDDAFTVVHQVSNLEHRGLRLGIELADYGAHGELSKSGPRRSCRYDGALAMRSALGTEMMLKAVINQRRQLSVGLDDDIATTTAVAAIGAALGTNASRLNDMHPAPPSPPQTLMRLISVNCDNRIASYKKEGDP